MEFKEGCVSGLAPNRKIIPRFRLHSASATPFKMYHLRDRQRRAALPLVFPTHRKMTATMVFVPIMYTVVVLPNTIPTPLQGWRSPPR